MFKNLIIQPTSPVIPDESGKDDILVAKDQPEYRTLPMIQYIDASGIRCGLTRWKVPFLLRLKLLFTGDLFIDYMLFNNPIQPLFIDHKLTDSYIERKEILRRD
jgi:hypothetical protein